MVEGHEGVNGAGPGLRPLENSTPEPHASYAVRNPSQGACASHIPATIDDIIARLPDER